MPCSLLHRRTQCNSRQSRRKTLDRTRAGPVSFQLGRHWPPVSVSSDIGQEAEPPDHQMKRVTGIGGVFIKSRNPEALAAWNQRHLGIDVQSWLGTTFRWQTEDSPTPHGATVWSVTPWEWRRMGSCQATFMINYRVADLRGLLEALRLEGCEVSDTIEEDEHGLFGWTTDLDGNRVELWQPPDGRLPD